MADFESSPQSPEPHYSGSGPDDRDPQPLSRLIPEVLEAVSIQEMHRQALVAHRELYGRWQAGEQVSAEEMQQADERLHEASELLRRLHSPNVDHTTD